MFITMRNCNYDCMFCMLQVNPTCLPSEVVATAVGFNCRKRSLSNSMTHSFVQNAPDQYVLNVCGKEEYMLKECCIHMYKVKIYIALKFHLPSPHTAHPALQPHLKLMPLASGVIGVRSVHLNPLPIWKILMKLHKHAKLYKMTCRDRKRQLLQFYFISNLPLVPGGL